MIDPKRIHLVLRHDEVLGRDGNPMHASVTQVDLHDFCRLTCTYGLGGFHVVCPLPSQLVICREMLEFWQRGYGKDYNPDRAQALEQLSIHESMDEVIDTVTRRLGSRPMLIGTSARDLFPQKTLEFQAFSATILRLARPVLIQFGTSWGLTGQQLRRCDRILSPIQGHDGYNHLSVRCAAAIIVDRIMTGTPHHEEQTDAQPTRTR